MLIQNYNYILLMQLQLMKESKISAQRNVGAGIMEMYQTLQIKKNNKESQWKSKSLDPKPLEKYAFQIKTEFPKIQDKPQQEKSFFKKLLGKKEDKKQSESNNSQRLLPSPKIAKINDRIFCMSIERQIKIYYFHKDPRIKRIFDSIDYTSNEDIIFVSGNNTSSIFIGHVDNLQIIKLRKQTALSKYEIIQKISKNIPKLKGFTFLEQKLLAVSNEIFYQFTIENLSGKQKLICFDSQEDKNTFAKLNPISLVSFDENVMYFFGTIVQTRIEVSMKAQNVNAESEKRQCEILVIVKFQIDKIQTQNFIIDDPPLTDNKTNAKKKQSVETIRAKLFKVDHVFELQIFNKSKIFVLKKSMFLMSLYEEVILIKQHFNKFIVWDNISILSSKSAEKKGQLVLADSRIMVYSEANQIYAYDLFFNEEESKLNMPPIDSFKGNDNDDEILYDAVLLQHNPTTLMKVLFYFKQNQIILPRRSKFSQSIEDKKEGNKVINFNLICITQSDPKQKLIQLLKQKKPANQINDFTKRFSISQQEKNQSQWQVSKKGIKDIQNILLQIPNDAFIQQQLDKILKDKPHDLNFLINVQKKQVQRLKKIIVKRLVTLYYVSDIEPIKRFTVDDQKQQLEYLNKVIQWLMESMMYLKKLNYSKNFLSFKEYDFIEIGKLKAASLKEQIKLLSCKKFQKRLKYFLNSFKYLAIANYDQIFSFLLENKSLLELEEFIMSFRFIMPTFVQSSNVFLSKRRHQSIIGPSRYVTKTSSDVPNLMQNQDCKIWDDLPSLDQTIQVFNSVLKSTKSPIDNQSFSNTQNFEKMIVGDIQKYNNDPSYAVAKKKATDTFHKLLTKFIQKPWFKNSANKQHCTLVISTQDIYKKFHDLKDEGVFKQFIRHVYRKVTEKCYEQSALQELLQRFVQNKILPQSFRRNIQARVKVYAILTKQVSKNSRSNQSFHHDIKLRQDFLTMKEENYFQYLLIQFKHVILRDIKAAYDVVQPEFFRQRFQFYLNSYLANIQILIPFIQQFYDSSLDSIRLDVFKSIKKLLKLNDYENTKKFNERSLDKQIFLQDKTKNGDQFDLQDLKEQAKVPYGFYFYSLFNAFKLDYTYQDLIKSSQCIVLSENTFIKQILQKYCCQNYTINDDSCLLTFEDGLSLQKIDPVQIHQEPLNFFGLLLYLLDTLDFKLHEIDIFNLIVQNYLNNSKFQSLLKFINQIDEFQIQLIMNPTRNFQILADFKEENYIHKILNEITIAWVRDSYKKINKIQVIEKTFQSIQDGFKLVTQFSRDTIIDKENAFFMMLKLIYKFDKSLLLKIDHIREQLQFSGFIFMMHLTEAGNITMFDTDSVDIIQDKIYNFYCIFSQFKEASTGEIIDSMQSPQLARFLIEFTAKLINRKYYTSSKRFLQKISGGTLYSRDIIFMFFSVIRNNLILEEQIQQFITEILNTETPALTKKKIGAFAQRSISFEEDMQFLLFKTENMFSYILQNHKPHEAFYFLLRVHYIPLKTIVNKVNQYTAGDINYAPYFVLIAYIRCLQKHLGHEFYPTFEFFRSKYDMLCAQMDRMDVIKDINIGLNRLHTQLTEETDETKKYVLAESKTQLSDFYREFMLSINMDPILKLTQEEFMEGSQRIDRYSRHIPPQILLKTSEQIDARNNLKTNQQKLSKVHKDNKVQVLQKQIKSTINEAKREKQIGQERRPIVVKTMIAAQREKQYEEIKKQQKDEVQSIHNSYKSASSQRVQEVLQSVRKKRIPNANSIISSDSNPKETVKLSRQQAPKSKTYEAYSVIKQRQQQREAKQIQAKLQKERKESQRAVILERQRAEREKKNVQNPPSNIFDIMFKKGGEEKGKVEPSPIYESIKSVGRQGSYGSEKTHTQFSGASQYKINISEPKGEEVVEKQTHYNLIQKLIQNPSSVSSKKKVQQNNFNSDHENLNQIKNQYEMKNTDDRKGVKKKVTLQEIQKLFKEKQPQAAKYLSKFQLIKTNSKLGVELIKRVFRDCVNFSSFEKFLDYLLGVDTKFKDIVEEKSLQLYNSMSKIDIKIDFKQLLPVEFFTTIYRGSIKQYYPQAFNVIHPSLIKILEKPEVNLHGIALLMRYGFGNDVLYYHKVFEDYARIILKEYQRSPSDHKKTFLLAEKLKNLYSNLNPLNRAHVFYGLIDELQKGDKKNQLIKVFQSTLARRSQIATIGNSNQQFANTIGELVKKMAKQNKN